MSWARLGDDWWCRPDVLALTVEARDLFLRLVSYCGQRLNDGAMADAEVAVASAGQPDAARRVDLLAELTGAAFLTRTPDGYQVMRFEQYLRARADVERDREIKRLGGLARTSQASRQGGRYQQAAGGSNQLPAGGTTSIRPVPSRSSFGTSTHQQAAGDRKRERLEAPQSLGDVLARVARAREATRATEATDPDALDPERWLGDKA